MSYNSIITHPVTQALFSAVVILPLLTLLYFAFEPAVAVGQGSTTEEFSVTQEIEGEIAFEIAPDDVTMAPAIPGLTGGTSDGSTGFTISTNNPAGYTVTIEFEDGDAMQYESGSGFIPNFGEPAFEFETNVAANEAAFGFSMAGPNVVTELQSTGSACGGGTAEPDECWVLDSNATDSRTIVDSDESTPSAGEAHEIYFRVHVNENPDPSLELGFYTATATLTATEKP